MSWTHLKEKIRQGLLLLDGAMGTQLIASGIEAGTCNDYLNIESPDIVYDVHRAYLRAGSDAILTNTFGANKFVLARHGLIEEVERVNTTGAKVARQAAGKEKYVLGDIGPTGDFLQPLGNLKPNDVKDAFAQQAKALVAGGVDGLIVESMTALEELVIAIEAIKSINSGLPLFASMAFNKDKSGFRTMMGVDVESAVSKAVSLGVDAVGFNCGSATLDEYVELAGQFVSVVKASGQDTLVLAEPNAGKPELIGGKAIYKVSPKEFALAVEKIHSLGVNIIGGCCGTGPEHIAAVAKMLKK